MALDRRNQAAQPDNHSYTRDTEKYTRSTASVLSTLQNPRPPRGFCRCPATLRPPENGRRRLALRPGGTPQEISRGQARASGRGPRSPRRTGHAPAGHRRSFWRRPPPPASLSPLVASGRSGCRRLASIPGHFFDAPLGHGATRYGFRGRRPLTRTCPRLISSGVPPGREPGGRALTKGNLRHEAEVRGGPRDTALFTVKKLSEPENPR